MTIAIGLICKDAVVLAADRLYESYDIRTIGPKVFVHDHADQPSAIAIGLTGAGCEDDIAETREGLFEALLEGQYQSKKTWASRIKAILTGPDSSLTQIVKAVEFPQIIIALKLPSSLNLFEINRANKRVVFREITKPVVAVGTGSTIALYLADKVFDPSMGRDDACACAAYIVAEAKKYGPGCGSDTDIFVLPRVGQSYRYAHDEILAAERYFETVYGHATALTRQVVTSGYVEELDRAVDALKPKLMAAWEERYRYNLGSENASPDDLDDRPDDSTPEDE
jgi:hypothetical protein